METANAISSYRAWSHTTVQCVRSNSLTGVFNERQQPGGLIHFVKTLLCDVYNPSFIMGANFVFVWNHCMTNNVTHSCPVGFFCGLRQMWVYGLEKGVCQSQSQSQSELRSSLYSLWLRYMYCMRGWSFSPQYFSHPLANCIPTWTLCEAHSRQKLSFQISHIQQWT